MSEKKSTNIKRGGARPGAGRKKGSPNKRTAEIAKAVEESGVTPLEYMLNVMRDVVQEPALRFEAAKAAAPYVHSKLSSVEHSGSIAKPFDGLTDEQLVELMNRKLTEAGYSIQ